MSSKWRRRLRKLDVKGAIIKGAIIIVAIVCVLVGMGGGYVMGYMKYEPKIEGFGVQVSELTMEVAGLVTNVSVLGKDIAELGKDITEKEDLIISQQSHLASLRSENATLQGELDDANMQIQAYEAQTATLEFEIAALELEMAHIQTQLSDVLNTQVTQHYQWKYAGLTWEWDLPISIAEYREYSERPRIKTIAYWINMAKDPEDDYYINKMVEMFNKAALERRYNNAQKLSFIMNFVQSLPYTLDGETTPYDEYPRYPLETLFDRGGDCEDTSILAAALLDKLGYDVALLVFEDAQHVTVGVWIPGVYGSYYEYDGKKYFYLETAGEGWQIGQIPPGITATRAVVYPL